jgi:hypothetical protein
MKKGFTFFEAIIIICVVSVLSVIAIEYLFEPDALPLARDQIILHIRYAQHLAVMDDKFDSSDQYWERKKWRIKFATSIYPEYAGGVKDAYTYTIFADKDPKGNHSADYTTGEIAVDPHTKKYLTGGVSTGYASVHLRSDDPKAMPELALAYWKITGFKPSGGCGNSVAFDEVGRPYTISTGIDSLKIMTSTCKWTLTHQSGESASICIEPETGWTHECD